MFGIRTVTIPTIDIARLSLRPFTARDAKRVQLLAGDEAVANGAINLPHPYDIGIARSWIKTHEAEFIKGNSLILAIINKSDNLLIGSIGLHINKKNKYAELGYWIGKEYWNNGFCSEAVSGIVNYAFEKLHLNKIFANFITSNVASGKVLEKNGFIKEGHFKQHVKCNGRYEDIECFGLLKKDHIIFNSK